MTTDGVDVWGSTGLPSFRLPRALRVVVGAAAAFTSTVLQT